MKVRVYRSENGDCLYITGKDGKTILVDGGTPDSYENHWLRSFDQVHGDKDLDLVIVSHIDRDHIGGLLEMFDNKVAWEVFRHQSAVAAAEGAPPPDEPELREPPDVKEIWHNAFFEQVRTDVFATSTPADLGNVLAASAAIMAGAPELRGAANMNQFLAQSVGDAIEVSRRIGADQLGISLNPDFNNGFMVRRSGGPTPKIGGMKATVIGPTQADLEELLDEWNEWVEAKIESGYLPGLLKKHDEDADELASSSHESILARARARALAFAGNQAVTPPNLASIVILLEEGKQSILLTGDADDPSILAGLEATGKMSTAPGETESRIHVDIFKVPHHGAHNSYSDELARRVTADHYVFCGDGEHGNPEKDVVEDYLIALFEDGAAPPGKRINFWFNCSSDLCPDDFVDQWEDLEAVLEVWEDDFPKFNARFLRSGQSFVVG